MLVKVEELEAPPGEKRNITRTEIEPGKKKPIIGSTLSLCGTYRRVSKPIDKTKPDTTLLRRHLKRGWGLVFKVVADGRAVLAEGSVHLAVRVLRVHRELPTAKKKRR